VSAVRAVFGRLLGLVTGGSVTRLAIALLVGSLGGAWAAHKVTAAVCTQDQLKAAQRSARDLARAVEQQDRAVGEYLKGEDHARTEYKTITRRVERIVERPVYRAACFDADGLQQLRAAIAGRAGPEPGAVPAVPPAR
jgi:uncharacterized protein YcfJ